MRTVPGSSNIALYFLLILFVFITWILIVSPPFLPAPVSDMCPVSPEGADNTTPGHGGTPTPFPIPHTPKAHTDWEKELKKSNEDHTIPQHDPSVINIIRENFIVQPNNKPYNCTWIQENTSDGQLQAALPYLRKDCHGFYVEFSASTGVWLSNSFYLETHLGWNGLLIEDDPTDFADLIATNRKAAMSPLCVSEKSYPHEIVSDAADVETNVNHLTGQPQKQTSTTKVKRQCFPLYTILLAANQIVVDFLSINANGAELDIMKTVPFDKVIFKVVAIEVVHIDERAHPLVKFMEKHGYKKTEEIHFGSANDYIFIHKSNPIQEVVKSTTTPPPSAPATTTPPTSAQVTTTQPPTTTTKD